MEGSNEMRQGASISEGYAASLEVKAVDMQPIADNADMALAWQYIAETKVSVFLTGVAGTGKTTFLQRLRKEMPKRMVVLAPTGVAAINAGGQTIHSFFQLPLGPFIPGSKMTRKDVFRMSERKKDLIRTLDLLVIDEISMVRADLLDQVDDVLRKYRDPVQPFGGVQLLLIGDLMQLSPVSKDAEWSMLSKYYATPYFFSSLALQRTKYITIELKRIYRQQDRRFIELLNRVRHGDMAPDVVEALNARYMPDMAKVEQAGWIRLTTHNSTAHDYNIARLAAINEPSRIFTAVITGDFPENLYPVDFNLELKVGAQVMFVKNDLSGRHEFYNGKIGIVEGFDDENKAVMVKCEGDTRAIALQPMVWDNAKYGLDLKTKEIREDVVGSFMQYPLRLAWAITVHKSQGLTFDHAVLDINASFAHGQVYVALSRCRTLEGLVLANPLRWQSVITDQSVSAYIDQELQSTQANAEDLPRQRCAYAIELMDDLFNFDGIMRDLRWFARVLEEHLSNQQPALLARLKDACADMQTQIIDVAQRFRSQYTVALQASMGEVKGSIMESRIKDAACYFCDRLEELLVQALSKSAVNIENKSVAETYKKAVANLRIDICRKAVVMERLKEEPFSIKHYLTLKALAYLEAGTGEVLKPGVKLKTKADGIGLHSESESKTKTKSESVSKSKSVSGSESESVSGSKSKSESKPPKVATQELTYELYAKGLTPQEIATRRSLTMGTVFNHLGYLAAGGRIDSTKVVPIERQQRILDEAKKFTEAYKLSELKVQLPEDYNYNEIRFTLKANS